MTTQAKQGFWITMDLYHDPDLTMLEKFVFAEICSLSMLGLGCIASNSHFSELLGIDKTAASRCIRGLKEKGYISVEISDRNKSRKITLNKLSPSLNKLSSDPLTKCQESKDKSTSINNTFKGEPAPEAFNPETDIVDSDNSSRSLEPIPPKVITVVIECIEKKAGRNFSINNRWLQKMRNDINLLYCQLHGDHERIVDIMLWYAASDSPIVIDSGFSLLDKFSRLEQSKNFKGYAPKCDARAPAEKLGTVAGVRLKPWDCPKCGTSNTVIDNVCKCGQERIVS